MPQLPLARYNSSVHSNYSSVSVRNANITADQAFAAVLEFNATRDYADSPATPLGGPASNIGDSIRWEIGGLMAIGQPAFDVQVDQLDRNRRFISVVTLRGHPLSGFRFWEVVATSGQSRDFVVRTGAVEHTTRYNDLFKAEIGVGFDNGNKAVLRTWASLLHSVAGQAGGTIVPGPDTAIDGKWDDNKIDQFKQKVKWRTAD